jgi:hypothetical protein
LEIEGDKKPEFLPPLKLYMCEGEAGDWNMKLGIGFTAQSFNLRKLDDHRARRRVKRNIDSQRSSVSNNK